MGTDVSNLSNDASNMLVAPVTPNRMLSPATTLPPPAPYKRPIFSKEDWENDLPMFPDLSGESIIDESVDGSSPSTPARPLARRIDEDDDGIDMIFHTPCQPKKSPA